MMAIRHLRHQPIVSEMFLPPSVIDQSNYKEFDMPVEARSCPKWEEVASN
jgi:ribose transport system substrate-binding protein